MNNWKETTLGEVCSKITDGSHYSPKEKLDSPYLMASVKDMTDNGFDLETCKRISKDDFELLISNDCKPLINDVLIAKDGSYLKHAFTIKDNMDLVVLSSIAILRPNLNKIEPTFLNYVLINPYFKKYVEDGFVSGSVLPRIVLKDFKKINLQIPPLPEQKAIAAILSGFDDKIELLRRQNKTIESIAQAIFKEWFVQFKIKNQILKIKNETGLPEGWIQKGLDEIADFLNGLPLQKYPPENEADVLPVIKIRELKSGITDQTDKASKKIEPKYIIDNGDVLFSWSGSLDVVLWCYGKGALNQHLFKVTSKKYPKWFYYYWILEHLPFFKSIAEAKATTMGHIQRHHLAEALVAVPDDDFMSFADSKIKPVFEHIISNNSQIQTFSKLRDALLPKLMKGEIRVRN